MAQSCWDDFFHTGKVDDYLKYQYREAENRAAALDAVGLGRPVLPDDATDGIGTGTSKPAFQTDVEQKDADQNGRRSSQSTKL